MATLISGYTLGDALIKAGLWVPDECYSVELIAPADGAMQLRYTMNVREEDLSKLASAIASLARK